MKEINMKSMIQVDLKYCSLNRDLLRFIRSILDNPKTNDIDVLKIYQHICDERL